MRTVTTDSASAEQQGIEELPERVQEALGELAGAAKEGLMALSVGLGLGVLHELMEAEVEEVVGPKGKHALERTALRHGHDPSSVTLGARRVAVNRPRVRSAEEKHEIPLATFGHFTARDALTDAVFERMLAGVSTRRFARTQEPVGEEVERSGRSTSKSAVSRAFVARTAETLAALMGRRLNDVRLAVLMLDGIELKGRTNVVALGVTTEGEKVPLGLWEGSSENAAVATALLADLVDRGLDTAQGVLCVLDDAKALRTAVRDVLGERTPVQRCARHKERNVLEHLPERDRPAVRRRLRRSWERDDHLRAEEELRVLAADPPPMVGGAICALAQSREPVARGSCHPGAPSTLSSPVTRRHEREVEGHLRRFLEGCLQLVLRLVGPAHPAALAANGQLVGCKRPGVDGEGPSGFAGYRLQAYVDAALASGRDIRRYVVVPAKAQRKR